MITVAKTEEILKEMIKDAMAESVRDVWNIFKEFSQIKVECAEDSLLYECGVLRGGQFYFSFLRQFVIEIDSEYSHMEQLECQFTFASDEELEGFSTTIWSDEDIENFPSFFTEIENLDEFKLIEEKYQKQYQKFQVTQCKV